MRHGPLIAHPVDRAAAERYGRISVGIGHCSRSQGDQAIGQCPERRRRRCLAESGHGHEGQTFFDEGDVSNFTGDALKRESRLQRLGRTPRIPASDRNFAAAPLMKSYGNFRSGII